MRRPRRRGNGEGSVVRRSSSRYDAVVTVGWTLDGRPIRRARSASSERAARALLREMQDALAEARPLPDDRLTVGMWLADWLGRQRTLRPATREAYARALNWMLPELGRVPLRRLNHTHVEALLEGMRVRGLAPNTAAHVRDVLSTALKDAIRVGHITRNAALLARRPRGAGHQLPAPDVPTVRAVLAALEGHRLRPMFLLLATTGLRLGEARGLRWEDIDGDRLRVRHQLGRVDGEDVLVEPKSERSRRTVILAPITVEALRVHHAAQAEERLRAGRDWREADLVFCSPMGQPLAETTAQWVLGQACARAGVRHLSPHDLRRFVATVVAEGTHDVTAAQALLGHATVDMTAHYASATEAALRRAAEAAGAAVATAG